MNKWIWRKWQGLVLALVLVITAGCQAIGGVDLNKALLSMIDSSSMEGSSSITLEFAFDDSAELTDDQKEQLSMIKLLSPLKLNFDRMKQESNERMSVSGSLEIPRGKIPFTASITPEELVFNPEGASKPMALKLSELTSGAGMPAGLDPKQEKALKDMETKFSDPAFLKPVYSYFVNSLPNPKNIKLTNVNDTINGESVSLHKVETSLNGEELVPWLKSYLVKLMQDDQGLKAVIAHLYDALKPLFDEAGLLDGLTLPSEQALPTDSELPLDSDLLLDSELPSDFDFPTDSEMPFDPMSMGLGDPGSFLGTIGDLLSDRETAIEVLHTEAKQVMVVLLGMLNHSEREPNPLTDVLNDKTYVKANIYVDNSLKIRKSEMELNLASPNGFDGSGISGVKVSAVSSNWNVNQEVKADIIPSTDAIEFGPAAQPSEMLEQLDKKSVLYQFLKNDLHIARKTVYFNVWANEYLPPSMQTYSEDGVTMVPARYLAEELGASIQWNAPKQTVTITDDSRGNVIVATAGSTTATVNGELAELEVPAKLRNGTLFVPLRFVSEALGAKVQWNAETETITVTID